METQRNNKGQFVKGHKPLGKPFAAGGQQVEIARRGNAASLAAKREKKSLKERLDYIDTQTIRDKNGVEYEKADAACMKLMDNAIKGDVKAMRLYAELKGELKPQENAGVIIPIQIINDGLD